MIIEKLIERERRFIGGRDIKDAIIIVPSYFISSKRQTFRYYCKSIGVNILRKNILVFYLESSEKMLQL